MNTQEIYKNKTCFDAYYHDGTPCKKYVKQLEEQFKTIAKERFGYDVGFYFS